MKKNILVVIALSSISMLSFQEGSKFNLKESISRGKDVYAANCMSCHQEHGEGLEDIYPPLAKSDYLMADKTRSIIQILKGASGEIKVNGKMYNGEMPSFDLNDREVSDVLNYIRNSFGNKGDAVKPEDVKAVKDKL